MPYLCDYHSKAGKEDKCPDCKVEEEVLDQPSNIEKLRVVQRPRAEARVQANIETLLAQLTDEVKAGQVDSMFIVLLHPDGKFSELISHTLNFRAMVGQVEVVKQNWIYNYLLSLSGKPGPNHGK